MVHIFDRQSFIHSFTPHAMQSNCTFHRIRFMYNFLCTFQLYIPQCLIGLIPQSADLLLSVKCLYISLTGCAPVNHFSALSRSREFFSQNENLTGHNKLLATADKQLSTCRQEADIGRWEAVRKRGRREEKCYAQSRRPTNCYQRLISETDAKNRW